MDKLIRTDMTLFGFPVFYDWRMDRKVMELVNPNGHRIRIELFELPDEQHPSTNAIDPVEGSDHELPTREKGSSVV